MTRLRIRSCAPRFPLCAPHDSLAERELDQTSTVAACATHTQGFVWQLERPVCQSIWRMRSQRTGAILVR